ncbi:MAG: polymorphic toxin type 23 domain-containing protein [Bacteroidetes bacterium]|nr:polymorphic toxin type 23 domain-containing protein [Bacteroidota bacterium]
MNMNGRIYDPSIGRFFSPDNYVQAPDFTQGLNKYSYCLNNPLSYTDQSGEWFLADDAVVATAGFALGYLSCGLSTGDWGSKAVVSGGLGALTAWIGLNTCGASFAASGIQKSTWNFVGNMTANTISSLMLPSTKLQVNDNVTITMGPSYGFGTDGFAFGAYASATYTSCDLALTLGTGGRGTENVISCGLSYYDRTNGQYWTAAINSFIGNEPQTLWQIGWNKGDWSIAFDEDAFISGDKYRTAAAEIGYNKYTLGMILKTTDHSAETDASLPEEFRSKFASCNRRGLGAYLQGSRIYSSLYLGYRNGNNITRIGIDSPWVQDLFQNGTHNLINRLGSSSSYFKTDYGTKSKLYFYNGNYHPFSLY